MTGLWAYITYPFKRQRHRRLSDYRPEQNPQQSDVPLGMEATDLDAVARTNRHNDALERSLGQTHMHMGFQRGDAAHSASHVPAMPENETYAETYFRAFQKRGRHQ